MNKIMERNIEGLRLDADMLSHLANSLNYAADTISFLTAEYEKYQPLKEAYMMQMTIYLNYLCEKNLPVQYNETCDEIRNLGFTIFRDGFGKHKIEPNYKIREENE